MERTGMKHYLCLPLPASSFLYLPLFSLPASAFIYRVIESIRLQGWSQCGLILGLLRSKNASMSSQDWAQITFR